MAPALTRLPPTLQAACKRYAEVTGRQPERLVSGSDDFTMFLWAPATSKAHVARMTGHVQLINQARPCHCLWRLLTLGLNGKQHQHKARIIPLLLTPHHRCASAPTAAGC